MDIESGEEKAKDLLDALEEEVKRIWQPLTEEVAEDSTTLACRCKVAWTGKTVDFISSGLFSLWAKLHKEGEVAENGLVHGPERREVEL